MNIKKLLQTSEGKQLEFKRDLSSVKPIFKTLVAFANTEGGRLVIGVDDAGTVGLAEPVRCDYIKFNGLYLILGITAYK